MQRSCGSAGWRITTGALCQHTAPLTALCSPAARWRWGVHEVTIFRALRELLSAEQVLCTFDPTRRPWVTTDTSQTAIAATLTQVDTKGNHQPVVFESHRLTAAEQTYPAHNLELLAVVHALLVWLHYLLGSVAPRRPGNLTDFTICTNNQAVTWLLSKKDLSSLHARCWTTWPSSASTWYTSLGTATPMTS